MNSLFLNLLYIKIKNLLKKTLSNIFHNSTNYTVNESIIKKFKKDGFFVIENYISKEECRVIINHINLALKKSKKITIAPDGADKRIFGSEYLSTNIRNFFNDKFLHFVCEKYLGFPIVNASTMAGYLIAKKNNKGSGNGWHRDDINNTTKAMIYLTDVTTHNGYFELIKDSNKFFNILRDHKFLNQDILDIRFDEKKILNLLKFYPKKKFKFPAKAGTLILFDPSNLHRGHPITKGYRYALTNYYFNKFYFNIEKAIQDKKLNKKISI
jgi:ectoine hydroxylase-related dioxygenase (phytanoyl-CoA dioxygenase family)